MESEKGGHSNPETDKSSEKLLERLQEQLYSSNASIRRRAAFHLSWLQEDGLEILKEVLFSSAPERTKNAAAYGLRKMRGRMKKMALEVFETGLRHRNSSVKQVCANALDLLSGKKKTPQPKKKAARPPIRELPGKRKPRTVMDALGIRRR